MIKLRTCTGTLPSPQNWSRRRKIIALVILGLISLGACLLFNGNRALWDTSETRYAEAAREMVSSGNWLVPRIGGHPHLTKPPVSYWLLALSMKIFGLSESAVRFPVAIAYAVTVSVTAWLGWRLTRSYSTGILAGILQMLSPLSFFGGHTVTTDTFVAMFALLYLAGMWGALTTSPGSRARMWMYAMYLFLGLAFLTKGPPALLPALAGVVFLVIFRDSYQWRRLVSFSGLCLFGLVASSWYISVLAAVPDALAVWKQEALTKVFVASTRNMPAVYYPVILVGGALPAVVLSALSFRRRGLSLVTGGGNDSRPTRHAAVFLSLWIALPLFIFMVSKTRLILYVLPLIPAVNLLSAVVWHDASKEAESLRSTLSARWGLAGAGLLFLMIGAKALVARHGDLSKNMKPVAAAIRMDAKTHHVAPELVITMDKMGNGLLYYLEGPPAIRFNADATADTSPKKSGRLASAFSHAIMPDHYQYVVVSDSDFEKYRKKLDGYAVPVYFNGEWGVFRRTVNSPVILNHPLSNRLVTQNTLR